jgi:methionine-rich copper-binding protein CopC
MKIRVLAAALAACLTAAPLFAQAAFAHSYLRVANPAVGSTVASSPPALECSFTEPLEPHFSSLEIKDAAGKPASDGPMHLDPADARRMILPLTKLAPGLYTVTWHATSVDTHRTEGHFTFTVAP